MTAVDGTVEHRAGAAVWWRGLGLLGGKGIALVRTIALARLLAPADFGLYAIAIVPLDLLLDVTDVGMGPALVQSPEVTRHDFDVAWTVGVLRAAGVGVVVALGAPFLAAAFGDPRATVLLRVLALRPVIAAAASARVAQLERELRYRGLVGIDLVAAVVGTVIALTFAVWRPPWALVAGTVSTTVMGTIASYMFAPYRPRLAVDRQRARALLRFGRWVLAGGVIAMIGEATLRAVIARMLGTDALGRYSLADTLAAAPRTLAGVTVGTVAFAVHARLQTDDRGAERAYRASILALSAALLPTYATLLVLAPRIAQLLGAAWHGTASVIQLLAVMGMLALAYDATASLLQGRGRTAAVAGLYAVVSATTLVLIWPLARAGGIAGAALARVVAELVVCVGCLWLARRALDQPFRGLARPIAAITGAAGAAAVTAALAVRFLPDLQSVIAGSLGALAAATTALWLLDRWLQLALFDTVLAAVRARSSGSPIPDRPVLRAEPPSE